MVADYATLIRSKEARLMTIPFETLRRKWMKDAKFRAEYERIGPDMELAFTLAEARRKAGLTQMELAARMGTSQARWRASKAAGVRRNGRRSNATPVPSARVRWCGCCKPPSEFVGWAKAATSPKHSHGAYAAVPTGLPLVPFDRVGTAEATPYVKQKSGPPLPILRTSP
jgi:hypothetical protein